MPSQQDRRIEPSAESRVGGGGQSQSEILPQQEGLAVQPGTAAFPAGDGRGIEQPLPHSFQRSRQLEFLQITANPIDVGIMGPEGRAQVLRTVSEGIGMPGADIVPSDDVLKEKAAAASAMQQQAAQAQGNQAPKGGNVTGDAGPRVNITGGPQ